MSVAVHNLVSCSGRQILLVSGAELWVQVVATSPTTIPTTDSQSRDIQVSIRIGL